MRPEPALSVGRAAEPYAHMAMEVQAANIAADLTSRRYSSFSDATRAVLEMLERQLPAGAMFVAHLDHDENRFRVLDARGDETFDLGPGVSML